MPAAADKPLRELVGVAQMGEHTIRAFVKSNPLGATVFIDFVRDGDKACERRLPTRQIHAALPGVPLPEVAKNLVWIMDHVRETMEHIASAQPVPERRRAMAPA